MWLLRPFQKGSTRRALKNARRERDQKRAFELQALLNKWRNLRSTAINRAEETTDDFEHDQALKAIMLAEANVNMFQEEFDHIMTGLNDDDRPPWE